MESNITTDMLIAALQEAARGRVVDGLAVADIVQQTGMHEKRVRVLLHPLVTSGAVRVDKQKRMAIDGSMRFVPVYRLKKADLPC